MHNHIVLGLAAICALLIAVAGCGSPTASEPLAPETAKEVKIGSDIGNRLPNFELTLTDSGEKLTSDSLLESGRPAVLFFFATT